MKYALAEEWDSRKTFVTRVFLGLFKFSDVVFPCILYHNVSNFTVSRIKITELFVFERKTFPSEALLPDIMLAKTFSPAMLYQVSHNLRPVSSHVIRF